MLETYEVFEGKTLVPTHTHKQFAGGEQHIVLDEITSDHQLAVLRGADSNDVIALMMWADAMRRVGSDSIRLTAFIPYLPGARADRGAPLGAKVYADMLQDNIDEIFCIDPHSALATSYYSNNGTSSTSGLKILTAWNALRAIPLDIAAVIAPDLGALGRAKVVADNLHVRLYAAGKQRDFDTMKLSGFVKVEGLPERGRILVVDDICDAGGTFVGLAEVNEIPQERLGLWVTHGIFSYGALDRLTAHYSWIGCTDSHPGSKLLTHAMDSFGIHGTVVNSTNLMLDKMEALR